ncbi:MAG TPA: aminotransferase class V-fold PLP-dependent enzyme [Terriglobia bacterium]|jgi:isopenicillin-N epimerase
MTTAPFGHSMLDRWMLDPSITYLNHGTVGAPPRRVLEVQQKLRDEIERQPSHFLLREVSPKGVGVWKRETSRVRDAANAVAGFLGARGEDLVFVDNTTSGVNAVLRSFDFREGDEVLVPDAAYGAILYAAEYATRVRGACVRIVEFPKIVLSPDEIVRVVDEAIGPKTRILIIDHVTTGTALILPIAEIAARCRKRGVAILVDAAHAPGAIPVDIAALGVDWYTGNLHKWGWSPRSSGILWVSPARQSSLRPTVISWGLDQGMTSEFDWPGTRDPTPHLAAPAGIAFMRELGVERVQRYNHDLAWAAGRRLAGQLGTHLLGPQEMIGTMITLPLPPRFGSTPEEAAVLRDRLLFEHHIEVHAGALNHQVYIRVSAQIYNEMADVERLAGALVS